MRAPLVSALAFALAAHSAFADPVTRDAVVAALPKLSTMAQRLVDTGELPGLAVAVVHDDEAVFLGGFGVRAMGNPDPVDADTVFQLASMSKPLSSTVIAALVTQKLVDWDDKVALIAPDIRLHDAYPSAEVTIRDFLNHRSGLPGTAGDDLEAIGYDMAAIRARIPLVPPSSSFRAGYAYSNAGFTLGATAAAGVTGHAWADVAETELYQPLGMAATSSRHADFESRPNRAALHVRVNGDWTAELVRDPDPQAPAGGASSSVRDLAQWMRLELAQGTFAGKPAISAEALAATHAPLFARGPNPVTGASSFYGLGWNVEYGKHGLTWGHAGAFSQGARTLVTLYPAEKLGIVVLAGAFPSGAPEALADSFFDQVFDGKVSRDWLTPWNKAYNDLFGPSIEATRAMYAHVPDPATPPLPASAYTGTYDNAYAGTATVTGNDEGLVLHLGPHDQTYPLRHFDRDRFLYISSPEMPEAPAALTFTIGPDGRAGSLTAESLDSSGLGTFERRSE
ncbi:CubicO group peptidase (beta-lactamase class C family) [Amaricoccus macauensis]|uniref:CubicO group peptidase (Beta-lactamase class C family) n=1 Tax=Amaricoccus macauensis TaxID=57001 RepID=A0A840SSZ2_9RHOB|nr:serine hydrolase [Amaricoccus macauensis]MBB5222443.1 CubicO group peptidase (beta-lactamase class C family) [Amaricoccus macauensis]